MSASSVSSRLRTGLVARTTRLGIALFGTACLSIAVLNIGASGKTEGDDGQIAKSLATMLRAGRTVVSKSQDRINDPKLGNKGIDAKLVLHDASQIYQDVMGVDPAAIAPDSRHGKLLHMQMDSIAEVMDAHQETINREGVGFKGLIPAVFARLVNEAFGRRAAGLAEIKVTAPPQLIRNVKVKPDDWELTVIQTKLISSTWPKDQVYSATAPLRGTLAERTLMPEYYGRTCLTCHGSPKGEIDITGYPKEGANEGDLGAIISIALYR